MPDLPADWTEITPPAGAERLDDDVDLAVRQLVDPWLASSNGHLDVACVEGDVAAAIGALGVRRARVAALDPADRAGLDRMGRRERRRPRSPARGGVRSVRRLVVARHARRSDRRVAGATGRSRTTRGRS